MMGLAGLGGGGDLMGIGGAMGNGGAAGQVTGSMGLDFGMHDMPLIGNFFQNPDEQHQAQQFHTAALNNAAYRPELANAYMNALRNRSSLYQGLNDSLEEWYGPQAGVNVSQMYANPMSPRMQQLGAPRDAQPQQISNVAGGVVQNGIPGIGPMF